MRLLRRIVALRRVRRLPIYCAGSARLQRVRAVRYCRAFRRCWNDLARLVHHSPRLRDPLAIIPSMPARPARLAGDRRRGFRERRANRIAGPVRGRGRADGRALHVARRGVATACAGRDAHCGVDRRIGRRGCAAARRGDRRLPVLHAGAPPLHAGRRSCVASAARGAAPRTEGLPPRRRQAPRVAYCAAARSARARGPVCRLNAANPALPRLPD